MLGCDALRRGFKAKIYTCNLQLFDPTVSRAQDQRRPQVVAPEVVGDDAKLKAATRRCVEYLDLGGRVRFEELTVG
ncbi:MAG: hypothetical protein IPP14_15525 [Planctomycetes bacterium]|nr:hypothetical protein [Planctomycetota bacterium]